MPKGTDSTSTSTSSNTSSKSNEPKLHDKKNGWVCEYFAVDAQTGKRYAAWHRPKAKKGEESWKREDLD